MKLYLEDPFTTVTSQVKCHYTEQYYHKKVWCINSAFSASFYIYLTLNILTQSYLNLIIGLMVCLFDYTASHKTFNR